jgi:hypothetical protein
MRRTGEIVLGLLAIVAGVGLFTAVIGGVQVPRIVLIVIPPVVIGWSIYHYVRPTCPVGREASKRLGRSRGALAGLVVIDCEEDRILRAVLVGMLREDDR